MPDQRIELNPRAQAVIDAAYRSFLLAGASKDAFQVAMLDVALGGTPVDKRLADACVKMRDGLELIRDSEPAESSARRIAEAVIVKINTPPSHAKDGEA
jgi:hypothetical protein